MLEIVDTLSTEEAELDLLRLVGRPAVGYSVGLCSDSTSGLVFERLEFTLFSGCSALVTLSAVFGQSLDCTYCSSFCCSSNLASVRAGFNLGLRNCCEREARLTYGRL